MYYTLIIFHIHFSLYVYDDSRVIINAINRRKSSKRVYIDLKLKIENSLYKQLLTVINSHKSENRYEIKKLARIKPIAILDPKLVLVLVQIIFLYLCMSNLCKPHRILVTT